MTTSPPSAAVSASSSNGASPSSLPRWRQFLSTLNWRPVRGIELEIEQIKQRSRQNESEAVQRMKQIEERTEQIESEAVQRMKQIEERTEQIESETEQIKKETEQLKRENARLRQLNAKGRALLSCVDQHCFPPESSSIPPQETEIDCGPSSP
jgi:hypothetical protein